MAVMDGVARRVVQVSAQRKSHVCAGGFGDNVGLLSMFFGNASVVLMCKRGGGSDTNKNKNKRSNKLPSA